MIDYANQTYTFTTECRMVWADLLVPKAFQGKPGQAPGKPRYKATFILPPDHPDLVPLKAMISRVWRAEFGDRPIEAVRIPIENGAIAADKATAAGKNYEFLRGNVKFSAGGTRQPLLSVFQNGTIIDLTDAEKLARFGSQFYGGVYAAPEVVIASYNIDLARGNYGVNAFLNKVLSTNKGDRIGGSGSGATTFAHIKGHATPVDPTVGADFPL